jgi:hypothetical protein
MPRARVTESSPAGDAVAEDLRAEDEHQHRALVPLLVVRHPNAQLAGASAPSAIAVGCKSRRERNARSAPSASMQQRG